MAKKYSLAALIIIAALMIALLAGCKSNSADQVSWSDLYQDVLTKAQSEFPNYSGLCSYCVYDIDRDGTPELFVKTGTCEADFEFHIYTVENGEAKELAAISGSQSSICGLSEKDGFVVQYGHMGYEKILAYYGTALTLPEDPEILFDGEVQEYHDLTPLDSYELDDATGLNWTQNPQNNNQAVIDKLA